MLNLKLYRNNPGGTRDHSPMTGDWSWYLARPNTSEVTLLLRLMRLARL